MSVIKAIKPETVMISGVGINTKIFISQLQWMAQIQN